MEQDDSTLKYKKLLFLVQFKRSTRCVFSTYVHEHLLYSYILKLRGKYTKYFKNILKLSKSNLYLALILLIQAYLSHVLI